MTPGQAEAFEMFERARSRAMGQQVGSGYACQRLDYQAAASSAYMQGIKAQLQPAPLAFEAVRTVPYVKIGNPPPIIPGAGPNSQMHEATQDEVDVLVRKARNYDQFLRRLRDLLLDAENGYL